MNPKPRSLTSLLIEPVAIASAPLRTSVRDLLRFPPTTHLDDLRTCCKPRAPCRPLRTASRLQAGLATRPTLPPLSPSVGARPAGDQGQPRHTHERHHSPLCPHCRFSPDRPAPTTRPCVKTHRPGPRFPAP